MLHTILLATAVLAFLALILRSNPRLPPGPAGYPIVGNLFQFPKQNAWLTFTEWAKQYGDIMHISLLGKSFVILSSREVVVQLLDKRGAVYSDRPMMPFTELAGYRNSAILGPYNSRQRALRKLITAGTRRSKIFQELQDHCTQEFLSELHSSPQNFSEHIKRCVANIVLQVSHGHSVAPILQEDPVVSLLETASRNFTEITTPGRWWVDLIPALKHVPEWFPGTAWKQRAKYYKSFLWKTINMPFDLAKDEMVKGTASPSFLSELLQQEPKPSAEDEELYRWASGAFYTAGSHTTVTTLRSFFLTMVLLPEVQKKAQEELDRIVGKTRLPGFEDREHLPYIEGVLKEIYRSHPVGPLALPHKLTRDDAFRDYFIPAGSTIYANSWAIMHNDELYPSSHEFKPERYLENSNSDLNPDPRHFGKSRLCSIFVPDLFTPAFGYGRRVCPGLPLADTTFFLVVVRTLAIFNISAPLDSLGNEVEVAPKYTTGMMCMPEPFECRITPRLQQAVSLLSTR